MIPKNDGVGRIVNEGGSGSDPENGIQVLPRKWEDLATFEESDQHTTPSGDEGRGSVDARVGISRTPLVRTPGHMGHIREAEGEVLVAGNVS